MSDWTHSICAPCWNAMHAATPERHAALDKEVGDEDVCCWCTSEHASGIYLRQAPGAVRCGGRGGTHGEARQPSGEGGMSG